MSILTLLFSKKALAIIAVIVLVGSITGGIMYVAGLRLEVREQQNTITQLEKSVKDKTEELKKTTADYKNGIRLRKVLASKSDMLAEQLEALQNKFNEKNTNGTNRDIGKLAVSKPELIRKIINNGTMEADRCMEIASGSAIKADEKNSLCQGVIDLTVKENAK